MPIEERFSPTNITTMITLLGYYDNLSYGYFAAINSTGDLCNYLVVPPLGGMQFVCYCIHVHIYICIKFVIVCAYICIYACMYVCIYSYRCNCDMYHVYVHIITNNNYVFCAYA